MSKSSKEPDFDQLKDDLEDLIQNGKKVFGTLFGNVKETVKEEIDDQKEKLGDHISQIKDKITKEASKPGTLQYIGAAFVVGLVVGALMTKKRDE